MAHNYTGCLVPIQLGTGTYNFPEKLPTTVSETEAKVFVMEISSKQFQFVRSSSRLDVMMGPLRWVITAQTTTRKGKIGGNNSNFVSADISPGASGQSSRVNHCEKKGACVMDVLTPGGGGGWVGWWVGGWMAQPFPQCVCVLSTIVERNPIRHRNFCARTECRSLGEQLPPVRRPPSVLLARGINKIRSSD